MGLGSNELPFKSRACSSAVASWHGQHPQEDEERSPGTTLCGPGKSARYTGDKLNQNLTGLLPALHGANRFGNFWPVGAMRCFHGFGKYREIGSLSNEPGNSQVLSGKFPELGLTEYTVGRRGSKGNLAGVSKGQECWLDRVTALVSSEHSAHHHHEAREHGSPPPP